MPQTTLAIGKAAEERACQHLITHGLHLLMRNYRLRCGEIDLILRDREHVVFTEVRYRKNQQFGGAIYTVDKQKQRKIIQTAQHYIQRYGVKLPVRFDVIAITGDDEIQWIQNAFEADW